MTTSEKKTSQMRPDQIKTLMKYIRKTNNYEKEMHFLKTQEIYQQEYPVIDSKGIRWCVCKYCGKMDHISEFISYGGKGSVNLGTCYDCKDLIAKETEEKMAQIGKRGVVPGNGCPYCGSKVVKRKGPYGEFWGCSKYPECPFKSKIKTKNY